MAAPFNQEKSQPIGYGRDMITETETVILPYETEYVTDAIVTDEKAPPSKERRGAGSRIRRVYKDGQWH